ncbi:MAG TPA: CAP domain-containing protein, partial [Candidatus Obscuribacterales bacterium]
LAELAGIQPGDVLLSLNTYTVRNAIHADRVLNQIPSGNLEIVFARPCQEPAATRKQGEAQCYKLIENRIDYLNPYKEFSRVLLVSPAARQESPARLEARALELINLDRSAHGEGRARLVPLRLNPVLSSLARETAAELVKRGLAGHASHEVQSVSQRLKQAGFQGEVGENILTGVLTVEEAEEEFMSEPADDPTSHRANILNPDFRYAGVGIALRPDHTLVVVQVFTREKPEPANETAQPGGDGKRL